MPLMALLAVLCAVAPAPRITLYVAPNGSDRWSGRLSAPNNTGTDGPFASLERARDALRALRTADRLNGPATVLVRQGVYRLGRTFELGPQDSGGEGREVTYRAYPGETATLSGARGVRGWRRYRGSVFVADLKSQGFQAVGFRELSNRGERQVLARFPNRDPHHPFTGGFLYVEETAAQSKSALHYKEGSLPLQRWSDTSQAEVVIWPYHCWDHNILRVARIDPSMDLITLRQSVAGSIYVGNRYYLQNTLGALDSPGEWYCDRRAGRLYFWPRDGKRPAVGGGSVPVLENVVQLTGTVSATADKGPAGGPIEHVRLHGFRIEGARQDGITLEGALRCAVTGCTITGVGGVGVNVGCLRNAVRGVGLPWTKGPRSPAEVHSGDRSLVFGAPCEDCRVAGNDVEWVGGDGIALRGVRNVADNNHLQRTGLYDMVSAAITMSGDENTASHNAIHDVPRDGIFINGARNTAEYNDIRHSMLNTVDNAAIALRQHDPVQAARSRGNVLRYNRIRDTIGYGTYPHCTHPGAGYASPFCSFGIYLDASISGVTVEGNIIARTGGPDLFIQFGGDNTVENNIFFEGAARRVQYDSMVFFGTFMFADQTGAIRDKEPPNRIRHNIMVSANPGTNLYLLGPWDNAPKWNRRQVQFDSNLLWHGGRSFAVNMGPDADCKSVAEWQAHGQDAHSLVADPLFVNAAGDDFRLRPGSPAYRLGFRDINAEMGRIGAYHSAERASWPLQSPLLPLEKAVVFNFSKEPQSIVDGFETSPVGYRPGKLQVAADGPGNAVVVEGDAKTGKRSLQFVDAAGMRNPWEPHAYCYPSYKAGKVHFSVDVKNSGQTPAAFYMEFRDWEKGLLVGPTFRVAPDGALYAGGALGNGGTQVARVPNGEWCRVAMDFGVGKGSPDTYTLTISVPGRPDVVTTQRFPSATFGKVTWFGISSTSTERAVFNVDNLVMGPSDSAAVREADSALSIRGPRTPARPPSSATGPSEPVEAGLAGWWPLDDAGSEADDRSGNGLSGDAGGGARARGAFGRALCLGGGNGTFEVPDHPLLQFGTGSFAIEAWVCPTVLDVASEHKRRRLIEKTAYPMSYWNLDVWSDGRVQMEMADDQGHNGTTASQGGLREKQWTHISVVVDRAGRRVSYYLNGVLDSARDLPADFAGRLDVPSRPLSVGTWQQFAGLLSGLRIYRRSLTAAEVAAHFAAGRMKHTSTAYTVEDDD